MKTIKNIAVLFALVPALFLSSCSKEYLNRTPTTSLDTDLVLTDPDKVPSTVVGTMRMMYSASFGGKYATIIGDVMTDMVTSVRGSNGSFKDMEEWNINQSTGDVEILYAAGFQIAVAACRTVEAAKKHLTNANLSTTQQKNLQSAIAASLTIKAYAEYFLTQYFCVDVNIKNNDYQLNKGVEYRKPGTNPNYVGIMLLDKPLGLTDPANIYSLEATYKFLEDEIAEAIRYFEESGSSTFTLAGSRYYPSLCAAYMIQARIFLAQHKYDEAYDAAENALNNLPSGVDKKLISDGEKLLQAYGENLSSEDIWTLNYTTQDNLSANSLQNLFGSYGFNPSDYAVSLFQKEDIRTKLYFVKGQTPPNKTYCLKYPNENGVFNVPIFRLPEIYLVQAEARAAKGNFQEAKEALLKVIGSRDPRVGDSMPLMVSRYKIQDDVKNIMQVILDENAREFLCEGHRWSDLRRNGARLTRQGDTENKKFPTHFTDYPLSTFAFPIPYGETSTEQWKIGHGNGIGSNENWQTNAWDKKNGDSYEATVTLPLDGADPYTSNAN